SCARRGPHCARGAGTPPHRSEVPVRFAYDLTSMPYLLVALGCGLLLALFATSLVLASVRRSRATKVFGDPKLITPLETFDASGRRALKGVLLVGALTAAFL